LQPDAWPVAVSVHFLAVGWTAQEEDPEVLNQFAEDLVILRLDAD